MLGFYLLSAMLPGTAFLMALPLLLPAFKGLLDAGLSRGGSRLPCERAGIPVELRRRGRVGVIRRKHLVDVPRNIRIRVVEGGGAHRLRLIAAADTGVHPPRRRDRLGG